MKKTVITTLMVLAAFGGSVATSAAASAAPAKKCPGENFQVVNGKCISDGRAEKIDDDRGNN